MNELYDALEFIGFKIHNSMKYYYEYLDYGFYFHNNICFLTQLKKNFNIVEIARYSENDYLLMVQFLKKEFPTKYRKLKLQILLEQK